MAHIPVLLNEVLYWMDPKPNTNVIDATIGGGGHAEALLERIAPQGKLLGIDWDLEAITGLQKKFEHQIKKEHLILFQGNFTEISKIMRETKFQYIFGIVADLGMSSDTLEKSGRGFSFQRDEPLLMTYNSNPSADMLTAERIVNTFSQEELEEIFRKFGDERRARTYANAIVKARDNKRIRTSKGLAEIIREVNPERRGKARIHPATKIFQALRIAVNNELYNLEKLIEDGVRELEPCGRILIISYHSLEDGIVKRAFKKMASAGDVEILTKKPIRPSREEVSENRRARSAKLRAAKKLSKNQ